MVVVCRGVWFVVLKVVVHGEDETIYPIKEIEFIGAVKLVFEAHAEILKCSGLITRIIYILYLHTHSGKIYVIRRTAGSC